MNKILAGTLVAVGLAGVFGSPAYYSLRMNALDNQLEEAGIYRAEELTTVREELGSALESCLNADSTEIQSPDCRALRGRYAAVGEELVQLVNTPEYQRILGQREYVEQEKDRLKIFQMAPLPFIVVACVGLVGLPINLPIRVPPYNPPKKK